MKFQQKFGTSIRQHRSSLTALDLKKIDTVYGPECRTRDRQEKIELCQNYPGVVRRKREVVEDLNLRVNRDITPPTAEPVSDDIKKLEIENEMQEAVDRIYKVSAKALKTARDIYCNKTTDNPKLSNDSSQNPDLVSIIGSITEYVKHVVDKATDNLGEFCKASESMEVYQRAFLQKCEFYHGRPCPQTYRSTKSGAVKYSTQHRPILYQHTKHRGNYKYKAFVNMRASEDPHDNSTVKNVERQGKLDENATIILDAVKNNDDVKNNTDATNSDVTVGQQSEQDNKQSEQEINRDRQKRDTKIVVLKNSGELNEKVKDFVKNHDVDKVQSRRATVLPKRQSKRARRRRFQSSREHVWEDSNVSIEKSTTKKKRHRQHLTEKSREENNEKREKRYKKKRPQRQRPISEVRNVEKTRSRIFHRVVELSKLNEEFYGERKWPDGVVRYIIQEDPNYDTSEVRRRLEEVNAILKRKTCVRIEEITENDVKKDMDYLVVDTSADYVTGRVGGRQCSRIDWLEVTRSRNFDLPIGRRYLSSERASLG
ncbi:unnamed protein product [Diatraea saccharalis]|uniref:Uncharacterized protein n=1 Tax=Diatraea saccharalis TaxID=40085 RepID=A0A9N9R6E5_9NEOP|nr:unnamed protein product [Diatraea saccharalis]